MRTGNEDGRKIGAVARSLEILEILRRRGGATLAELEAESDLSKGSVFVHLETLADGGFVTRRGDQYVLGRRFISFGERVRNSAPLFRAGKDQVDALARESEECVHLIVEDNGLETILYEAFGSRAVGQEFFVKNREETSRHLHYSAAGKSILAGLDREDVEDIIDCRGLPERTTETITDADELFTELDDVRESGYATNEQEDILGIQAVGVPIRDAEGTTLGGLSISAPTSRLQGDQLTEEMPTLLREHANIIEVNLQTIDI